MWIVEHEADVASDLSAFHRIDDPLALEAVRYFSLAERLTAYAGVMAAIAAEQARKEDERKPTSHHTRGRGRTEHATVPEGVALAQLSDGWVEHTTS